MKILVSDLIGDIGIRMFQTEERLEVDVNTGLSHEELKKIIGKYDALIIRSATKVTKDLLESADRLKVIGRAGIGLDNVDVDAATKRGIVVMNTPGGNVVTTAEHAISLMLSLTRNIPQGTASLKAGFWNKKKLQGREIQNKVIGIIGFGKIGSIVADRAKGLKMSVIVHDPYVTSDRIEKNGFKSVSLKELYQQANYITIHVPKLKNTAGFIDKAAFDQMQDGVMLINCSRGGIVSEDALYDAIINGKVAGAALDVFQTEPPGNSKLFELDQIICTPHLGASTREAQMNVAAAVAKQIIDYLINGTIVNAVNVPSVTGELLQKVRPYLTLVDRMGCFHAQLAQGPIKEVVIEYRGDFNGLDMSSVKTAFLKGMLFPVLKDEINFVNAHVIAKERGIKIVETTISESEDYLNLINLKVISTKGSNTLSGTIFGKKDPRIVKVNEFRLEVIPEGYLTIIQNIDKPGAIGSIGVTLGNNGINIVRMQVGQHEDGDRNIIFLRTNMPIPDEIIERLKALPLIKVVTPLEL